MRVHQIKIGVKDVRTALDEARDTMERIIAKQPVQKIRDINFTSYEALRKLLTPRRLELLHVIKEKRPQSAYELAHILGRDLKNVNADLTLLANIGLVGLRKTTKGRKTVVPWVTVDRVHVEITI